MLTPEERRQLLDIAREAVKLAVADERRWQIPAGATFTPPLIETRAVFVSLHKGGALRGCIGSLAARFPLVQAVAEAAYSAALQDPRFEPVTADEIAAIDAEISVLSPFQDILPQQIIVGRHGLLVTRGYSRGLLLPQVAVQHNWDAERFLAETCRKAGLEPDAWKRGASIEGFTAEVFGEQSDGAAEAR